MKNNNSIINVDSENKLINYYLNQLSRFSNFDKNSVIEQLKNKKYWYDDSSDNEISAISNTIITEGELLIHQNSLKYAKDNDFIKYLIPKNLKKTNKKLADKFYENISNNFNDIPAVFTIKKNKLVRNRDKMYNSVKEHKKNDIIDLTNFGSIYFNSIYDTIMYAKTVEHSDYTITDEINLAVDNSIKDGFFKNMNNPKFYLQYAGIGLNEITIIDKILKNNYPDCKVLDEQLLSYRELKEYDLKQTQLWPRKIQLTDINLKSSKNKNLINRIFDFFDSNKNNDNVNSENFRYETEDEIFNRVVNYNNRTNISITDNSFGASILKEHILTNHNSFKSYGLSMEKLIENSTENRIIINNNFLPCVSTDYIEKELDSFKNLEIFKPVKIWYSIATTNSNSKSSYASESDVFLENILSQYFQVQPKDENKFEKITDEVEDEKSICYKIGYKLNSDYRYYNQEFNDFVNLKAGTKIYFSNSYRYKPEYLEKLAKKYDCKISGNIERDGVIGLLKDFKDYF